MATLPNRLVSAWNAFLKPVDDFEPSIGIGYGYPPNRTTLTGGNEHSIVSALYNRIAVDVSAVNIEHCRVDDSDRFVDHIRSGLNNCLTLEANIDQSGRDFIQDLVLTMFDQGAVAVVPVDVDVDPLNHNSYDILTMRVGRVVEWFPRDVRVDVYNDRTGLREELTLPKTVCAVIQNPLYSIMNEPNSTLQRLIRKLNLLDAVDEQSSSGKLDLIIQLPYVIKSEARRQQAEARRKAIEEQLEGSRYGIAYTDGTERITQLNRSVENNLLNQVQYLTTMLYGQLGISEDLVNGKANEQELLNYQNRTLEPILSAICDGLTRTFLTKTARTQGQTIKYFQDPFKLCPVTTLADIADKFTRNEIMSSNEFRGTLGLKKSDDPAADELRNSNLNRPTDASAVPSVDDQSEEAGAGEEPADSQNGNESLEELEARQKELDDLANQLDQMAPPVQHYASPYYDPQKAHEYYMRTREPKGKSMNTAGKEALSSVKANITAQKEQKLESQSKSYSSEMESLKNELMKLADLEDPKKFTVEYKKVRAKIDSLRAQNSAKISAIKNDARNKIKSETAKIKSDKSFQSTGTTTKSSSRKKSSSSSKKSSSSSKYSSSSKSSGSSKSKGLSATQKAAVEQQIARAHGRKYER